MLCQGGLFDAMTASDYITFTQTLCDVATASDAVLVVCCDVAMDAMTI